MALLNRIQTEEKIMGKYFLAWILGVPGIVLLLIWLFFH